jgi:2-polyprenyl-3-methyl-5-hydroxy-6-metoxy-1,4-benzoquinol methylase
MIDEHYANPKLADIYDLDSGWDEGRDFYLSLAPSQPINILDLGCGTGLLCDAYSARGHCVTGVDPAHPMLDVARRKSHGKNIEWVCATAQNFRSNKRFDLIIMTGHAFQVFLSDEDVVAVFKTMRHHLNPEGRIVFETRNPAIDWVTKWQSEFNGPQHFVALSQNDEIISFDMHYRLESETLTSRSTLRFLSRQAIEQHLAKAGLDVKSIKGDWQCGAFNEARSLEMIFEVQLSSET